jgi:transcriptional regulator with XRE-family HTH domain
VSQWGATQLKEEVGRAIRRRREALGLSQADLAEAIGRSIQSVGEIERGRSAPTFETLDAIAGVLGAPVRDFFPGHPEVQEDANSRLLGLIAPLGPEERAWVERVLAAVLRRPERP